MNSEDDPHNSPGEKSDSSTSEVDEPVGYKRPPKKHRFRKGKSGNSKGRTKKSKSRRQIVQRVLFDTRNVDLTGNGRAKPWTIIEIVVMSVRQAALEGNTRALKTYADLESQFGTRDKESKGGVVIIPTVDSFETWMKLFGPKD
jgi:hypothetical protein